MHSQSAQIPNLSSSHNPTIAAPPLFLGMAPRPKFSPRHMRKTTTAMMRLALGHTNQHSTLSQIPGQPLGTLPSALSGPPSSLKTSPLPLSSAEGTYPNSSHALEHSPSILRGTIPIPPPEQGFPFHRVAESFWAPFPDSRV